MTTVAELSKLDESDLQEFLGANVLSKEEIGLVQRALDLKQRIKAGSLPIPQAPLPVRAIEALPGGKSVTGEFAREPSDKTQRGIPESVGRQIAGTVAGAVQGVPLAASLMELPGETLASVIPSQRENIGKVVPIRGTFERAVEEAPSPFLARLGGWMAAPAAALMKPLQAGAEQGISLLGKAIRPLGPTAQGVQKAAEMVQSPATRTFQTLAGQSPGFIRTVEAGAGTGAALGASEAAISRLPNLIPGTPNVPFEYGREVLLPGAMGAGMSVLPGVAAWANRPESEVSELALQYARDRAAGLHKPGTELTKIPSGQTGVNKAAEIGRTNIETEKGLWDKSIEAAKGRAASEIEAERGRLASGLETVRGQSAAEVEAAKGKVATEKEAAALRAEDILPGREAPIKAKERGIVRGFEEQLGKSKEETELQKGKYAAEIESKFRQQMQQKQIEANKNFQAAVESAESSGKRISTAGLYEEIEGIVRTKARQPEPGLIGPEADELTPMGKALRTVENFTKRFLQEDASIADYRALIGDLKSYAASGTPEKAYPYKKILKAVRNHLAAYDPDIARANAEWNAASTETERTQGIVYRKEGLHELGKKAGQSRETDIPEEGNIPEIGEEFAPKALTPAEEESGRKFFLGLEDTGREAAARAPQIDELIKRGYGPHIEEMKARLAEIKAMTHETQAMHEEAIANAKAEIQRELLEIKRQVQSEANAPVAEAETGLARTTETARGKVAQAAEEARAGLVSAKAKAKRGISETKKLGEERVAGVEEKAEKFVKSKTALEASRPRFRKVAKPILYGAMAATSKMPAHAASMGGAAAETASASLAQPVASRAAYYLAEPGITSKVLPSLQGLISASRSSAESSRKIVDAAKQHSQRLKASIEDRLKAREEEKRRQEDESNRRSEEMVWAPREEGER